MTFFVAMLSLPLPPKVTTQETEGCVDTEKMTAARLAKAFPAKRFGVEPLPDTRMTITERAYTSPIWYTP